MDLEVTEEKVPTRVLLIFRRGESYLSRLTTGQYTKVLLTDTQQANGQWMEAYLSKALDQLYVAIWICFYFPISEEDENSSVTDDGFASILIEKRLSIMLELMEELSRVTQAFYFTTEVPPSYPKRMYQLGEKRKKVNHDKN